jgi:spermidine/putrescine transport system permease protein
VAPAANRGEVNMAAGGRREKLSAALPLLLPAYLWLLAAVFLPLSAMFFFSFLSDLPFAGRPWEATLENYRAVLTQSLYTTLLVQSLRLGAEVTFWCFVLGFPAAFALAKLVKGRSREAIFLLVILPFWSNGLVRVFSWAMVLREGGLIDTGLNAVLPFTVGFDILYTRAAVLVGLVHSYLPYMVLTSYLALEAIEDGVIEAARSLGASRLQILWRLVLPLSLPGIAAGAALIFVPVVGSFMEPRLLGGREGTTIGTVIEDQFVAVFNWPLGAALSFTLLAIVLVVLALAAPALRRAL